MNERSRMLEKHRLLDMEMVAWMERLGIVRQHPPPPHTHTMEVVHVSNATTCSSPLLTGNSVLVRSLKHYFSYFIKFSL